MRVLKKILIGLGSLFLVLIALFAWLGVQSARFRRAEAPFVQAYLGDLSRRWNVADVYDRSANILLTQADSPEGRRAIEQFKPLGALTSIHDFELKNYTGGTGGQRGVFDFRPISGTARQWSKLPLSKAVMAMPKWWAFI